MASRNGSGCIDTKSPDQLVSDTAADITENVEQRFSNLDEQNDLQTEQVPIQGNYIVCLDEIGDYEKKLAEQRDQWTQFLNQQREDKEGLWNKIYKLEEALDDFQKQHADDMIQTSQHLKKPKTSGCFDGIMNWCR